MECTKKSSDRVSIKIKQTSSMVENDIHICATYIPPHASSSYSLNEPPWTDLQRQIIHFDKMDPIVLIGDLNLFADDIVLFTDDPRKLQNQIYSLHLYCRHKYLEINSDKTKILVFGQKSLSVTDSLEIGPKSLEIVNKYKYLGTWLCWNCDFKECLSQINKKANKSLCNLQTKIVSLGITNVNILLTLINTLIKPILIYNSEIWGLYDVHQLEKIQCKYLKFVLRVSNSSVNTAVLAETGTPPLSHDCVSAVLKYFYRITSPSTSFLTRQALEISNSLNSIDYTSWVHLVKMKLLHLGFNLDFVSPTREVVLSRLHDQTIQQLRSDINCTQGLTPSGGSKLIFTCHS